MEHKCFNEARLNQTDLQINTINNNMKNMGEKLDKALKILELLDEKLDRKYA